MLLAQMWFGVTNDEDNFDRFREWSNTDKGKKVRHDIVTRFKKPLEFEVLVLYAVSLLVLWLVNDPETPYYSMSANILGIRNLLEDPNMLDHSQILLTKVIASLNVVVSESNMPTREPLLELINNVYSPDDAVFKPTVELYVYLSKRGEGKDHIYAERYVNWMRA